MTFIIIFDIIYAVLLCRKVVRNIKQVFNTLVGNDKLKNKIFSDISSSTVSHAYIIEGKKGSGRHTVSYMLSAALACQEQDSDITNIPCLTCPSCKKILNKKSPDVIVIGRDGKASIGVETIRFLKNDIHTIPNDIDYKIYIIEDADLMTTQAQNAFLLTLEEPPKYVKYFLLCEDADSLLETIRSRAQVIRTEPIKNDDIDKYLCDNIEDAKRLKLSSPEIYNEVIMSAEGCIGRAIDYIDPKIFKPILQNRNLAKAFVKSILYKESGEKIYSLIAQFGSKRDVFSEQIRIITMAIRDLILLQRSECAPLLFYYDREEAISLTDMTNIRHLMDIYNALISTDERIAANANVNLSLIKLFSDIKLL